MASPVALPSINSAELIDYILRLHKSPTTLVICASRESFLQSLQVDMRRTNHDNQLDSAENSDSVLSHPFLIPTIHLLASSKTVCLAFTPTLPHLRAFLANFSPKGDDSSPLIYQRPGSRISMLAIFNLAAVHRSTSEYSAQGLSQTIAIAVEAAKITGMKLVLAESCNENQTENATEDPWKPQVPLLNGSIRSDESEKIWAGRTIDIRKVIGRWCRFIRLDEDFIELNHSQAI